MGSDDSIRWGRGASVGGGRGPSAGFVDSVGGGRGLGEFVHGVGEVGGPAWLVLGRVG